jgi:ADP-glucose pyrophosphorylase
MIITYRGKAVCRLEPLNNKKAARNDPFYELYRLADETAENLTNAEIDKVVYES